MAEWRAWNVREGAIADRPAAAATNKGYGWYATDTDRHYRSDGAIWHAIQGAGVEYVSTTYAVSATGGFGGDANKYGLTGGEAGLRYQLGGAWFTPSSNSYHLEVGTYLIFYTVAFGDPYQNGGTPLAELMDGVSTFATGGASTPTASPWILFLSNVSPAGSIVPFVYSVTPPGGTTYMSFTVVRLADQAGVEVVP